MRMHLMVEALAQAWSVLARPRLPRWPCSWSVSVSMGGQGGAMRAADHQFQQPLTVGVMDRQGTPGVKFDVEGSGYGFRVIRRITAAGAATPQLRHGAASVILQGMRQTIQNLEESKIREVANAGMGSRTCWPSGLARATKSRPDFIRQAAVESLQKGETFYNTTWACPSCARRWRTTPAPAWAAGGCRPHCSHLQWRQCADAGHAGPGGPGQTKWWRSRRSGPTWPSP
jgi:hypothetical protein